MTAIAILVKTPGHSPLKTRLARETGTDWAEAWHRRAALTVAAVADAAGVGPVYWAVAEPDALDHALWQNHAVISQGQGSLGERMARVHNQLAERHDRALLLGADAPQLAMDRLKQAAKWLDHQDPRICIGPARDGGFWTFGANIIIDPARWQAVPYSSAETLVEFRRQMHDQGAWLNLPELTDLDEIEDLPDLMTELENLAEAHPHQVELLRWIGQSGLAQHGTSAT